MFTVKHHAGNGESVIYGCERFAHSKERGQVFLTNPNAQIDLHPADSVFVENAAGKTVYAIRPPREDF